ncbi:HrpD5 family protein [Paraburkholderia hayleyella]|uniref:HrpD5 family protein n=1 Tax=Paraburkholderia hayleyella TaxID=2152889 RepID=UPI001291CEE6|nr:HrpD5 family protein [Paraburkholderia hayleyella]
MIREFRLLTGVHAGARLQFSDQPMTLGRSAHADIVINDWDGPDMQLVLEPEGRVTLGVADCTQPAVVLEDLVPRRFGDIVLCVGPADVPWPGELQLLQNLLTPAKASHAAARVQGVSRSRLSKTVLGAGALGVLALVWSGLAPQAANPPLQHASLAELRAGLARLHLPDIELRDEAHGFSAHGIVASAAQGDAAQRALNTLAGTTLAWHVKTQAELTQQLQESLHDEPNVQASYLGQRRFALHGEALHPALLRLSAQRFRADLEPLVADVAVQVSRSAPASAYGEVESVLSSSDVRYVESSDGAKHFSQDTALAATPSLSVPAPSLQP